MFQYLLFSVFLWQAPSFIEQSTASAIDLIAKEPAKAEGYNELALAMVRKERETGDASFLQQAESAIQKSLKLEPANFGGRKARVALRLRQHRYEDALEEAETLRKERPDENSIYAYISEADIALGNYSGAEKAVQRMLDLRSVNGPGFEAGAIIRELIGYPDGAVDWWTSALHLVSDRDYEERAYILSQVARLYRETGKYEMAAQSAEQALRLERAYPEALLELARVRIDQKQAGAAIELLRERLKRGEDLESLYWLGMAQTASGNPEGKATLARFEMQARSAATSPSNANALLVFDLTEHGKAQEAITIAQISLDRRQDLFTRHAYALALAGAGRNPEALEQIKKAIEPGLQDANLYFDAGMIAKQSSDSEAAKAYFRKAFEINTNGPVSAETLKQLGLLEKSANN